MFTENIILHIIGIISKKLEFFFFGKDLLMYILKSIISRALKKMLFNLQYYGLEEVQKYDE